MTDDSTQQTTEGAAAAAPSATQRSGGRLELVGVTKVFPGGTVAVEDVNLTIEPGEYVVLLGPSGCGKTTTLRMIGGHEYPTSGQILLDGSDLAGLPPDRRETTTVFQHFALFPHRSVLENVEFGLKMQGMSKEDRRARAMEALEMVGLQQLSDRRPKALSGGQQQRVALARVLVTSPRVLLLDEPLGDLDRLLQLRMRVELRNLQRQLGITFIHVTHNQEESLSMADRIVVMHEGRIQQADDPLTISTRPKNEIVAAFMGDNNIMRGKVSSRDNGRLVVDTGYSKVTVAAQAGDVPVGGDAVVSVRAAALAVHDGGTPPADTNTAQAEIVFVEYLGDLVKLHMTAGGERMLAKVTGDRFPAFRGKEGSTVPVSWKEEDVQLLGS